MRKPRQYTPAEVRDQLLDHMHHLVDYWADESRVPDTRRKLEGLAFSICASLDGDSPAVPSFMLIPNSRPEDRKYHKRQGENWYPPPKLTSDIGILHEFFYRRPAAKARKGQL